MLWKPSEFLAFVMALLLVATASADDVFITGAPATRDFVKKVLSEQDWRHFPPYDLDAGDSWRSPTGDRVINVDWVPPRPAVAALSDHPEKVERRGALFSGGLTPFRRLIFQYYHLGKLRGNDPHLSLYLYNPGSKEATLHVQRGIGRTSLDYFSSGHTNNVRWFEAEENRLGYFVDLQPGETQELFRQPLPIEEVVSGTIGLTQTQGPLLQFAFVARPADDERPSLNNLLKKDDVHSRGFYPAPRQLLQRSFWLGQEPMHLAIGAVRQQTFSGVRELRGDYGVTYDMDLELVNDTSDTGQVELVFNPRGGAATGTFLLDGELIEVENTKAFEERVLYALELAPGDRRALNLKTIPEGASSYPVRIIVRQK